MEKDFKSNFCVKLRSRSNSNAHIVSQHEGPRYRKKHFKCNVCQYKVGGESDLIVHMRKHTGERPFKCTVDGCGKEFKVPKTLKEHMSYKHCDERPFKCTFPGCRCTTKTYTDLFAHKRVHSEDRPFACPKAGCNYRAKKRSNVRVHAKIVHSGAKPFACSQCDFRTAQKSAVKSHMMCRHSARRDFKCSHPQCTKSFKTSWDLKNHFSTPHQERNIQCDHPGCRGTFPTRRALNNHKQGVHSKKSIACPSVSCKFRTSKTAVLALHMIKHDRRNEKIPCSTEGCDFKGKNSLDMQSHMRHHKIRLVCPILGCSQNTFTEQALKDQMKLHNPVGRPSQCPLCYKHFTRSSQLQSHVFAHTNEKPLKWGHCEYSTSARGVLRRHISSLHAKIKFKSLELQVVKKILEHFPNGELLKLSFVNKLWNFEARSVMRERGDLMARTCRPNPRQDLVAFLSDLKLMNVVPFSGIRIFLHECNEIEADEREVLALVPDDVILDQLPLTHFFVQFWTGSLGGCWWKNKHCPAFLIAKKMLQYFSGVREVILLQIYFGKEIFIRDVLRDCSFPSLKTLRLLESHDTSDVANYVKTLISRAPNLQEIYPAWSVNIAENILEGSSAVLVLILDVRAPFNQILESAVNAVRLMTIDLYYTGPEFNFERFKRMTPMLLQVSCNSNERIIATPYSALAETPLNIPSKPFPK